MSQEQSSARFLQLLEQLRECHEQQLSIVASAAGTVPWERQRGDVLPVCAGNTKAPTVFQEPCGVSEADPGAPGKLLELLDSRQVDDATQSCRTSKCHSEGQTTHCSEVEGASSLCDLHPTTFEHRDGDSDNVKDCRFQIRDLWMSASNEGRNKRLSRSSTFTSLSRTDSKKTGESIEDYESEPVGEEAKGFWEHIIAFPGSPWRLGWDLIGGLLIIYDLIMIPLRFFEPPETPFTLAMDWATMIFWTLNVAATLTVGYVDGGVTITEPKKILKNYLKTWFIVDLLVLTPDWVCEILAVGEASDSVRILRTLRLARSVRLLRLVKLRRILDSIKDSLDSEYSSLVFNIFKMMVILLAVCHVMACCWFALARLNKYTTTMSWAKVDDIFEWHWSEQYIIAMHWSLTQFTPSTMHVQPQNNIERVYAVSIVIFALVGFAYVVGSITGSLAQLRLLTEQASKDFWLLRRFLKQNAVPRPLAMRIQRFLEHAYRRQKKTMAIGQVGVLSLLSKQLTEELQCAINLPHMKVHPLFKFLSDYSCLLMNRLAKEAVGRSALARGDTLFLPEQLGTAMYFIASGRINYCRRMLDGEEVKEQVSAGEDWLGEPVLWSQHWYYVGEAKASCECELLLISTKAIEDILSCWKPIAGVVGEYGRNFMAWMEQQGLEGNLSDVIQGDQVSDLLYGFIPDQAKQAMAPSLRTSRISVVLSSITEKGP